MDIKILKNKASQLIKRMFCQDKNIHLKDTFYNCSDPKQILLASYIYMPDLIEIENSILLAWNLDSEAARKKFILDKQESSMTLEELEASYNWVEVGYLFNTCKLDNEEIETLAYLLCHMWSGWLNYLYPSREFAVRVIPEEETGSILGVGFEEIRSC